MMTRGILCAAALLAMGCRGDKASTDDTGTTVGSEDADGDGYIASEDCDDTLADVNPGADELCDGVDNDCDGDVDEEVTSPFYADVDGDGFGDPDAEISACEAGDGYVSVPNDCDDRDPDTFPSAPERCDEVDNDCDGTVDEDVLFTWFADADADGYGDLDSAFETCDPPPGYVDNSDDCDDTNPAALPGGTEVCDEADNDCDGSVDEDVTTTYYQDVDGDNYGLSDITTEACSPPTGYAADPGDCDDAARAVNPSATEVCDTVDNNCDGTVDEDSAADAETWYADGDGDGYGDASSTAAACSQPTGYVSDDTDCDDREEDANPGEAEVCDGIDNDCDGDTDDADSSVDTSAGSTYYEDDDGDGYGDADDARDACAQPKGYVSDDTDCDDGDAAVSPGEVEACNDVDDDCDGDIDEGVTTTFYLDYDGDGYGDVSRTTEDCSAPSGYVSDTSDCDDTDADINPAGAEVCNGDDDDCDGTVDEDDAADSTTWYADTDGDGYGDTADSDVACDQPSGYVEDDTDCDDTDAEVSPAAEELCDEVDNDCDGDADEDGEVLGAGEGCAAEDCLDVLNSRDSTPSDGLYWVEDDDGTHEVKCDMTTDGGGWTLLTSEETESLPGYSGSWWTSATATGAADSLSSAYKSEVYDTLAFSELLYVVYPDDDDSDQIQVLLAFSTEQTSLHDAYSGSASAASADQLAGSLEIRTGSSTYPWAFNASCSSYGGGTVRLGAGDGQTCNTFYGMGCTGGTYCGVSDFTSNYMASNTDRYFPSGEAHDTFDDIVQIWVR